MKITRLFFFAYKVIRWLFRCLPIYAIGNRLIFSFNNVIWPRHLSIRGLIYLSNKGNVLIGKRVIINSNLRMNPIGGDERTIIIVKNGGNLSVGNNVGISNSTIVCWNSILIEDDVNIGGGCHIYDTDFHSIFYSDRVLNGNINIKTAPVIIRKGAWLGAGVIVLKGVEIGERAVIGAGAVVTKNIPADEVWGGNPARFIKKFIN